MDTVKPVLDLFLSLRPGWLLGFLEGVSAGVPARLD